jgi:predicted N-acetyltransferase YhbS
MAGLTRPLTAEDDRNSFDCGRESLNSWFQRHAWRNQIGGTSRTSVICDGETGAIAGYVSLSAAQIEREHLPKSAQRNRPNPIPVILLGQLAVERRHQEHGYARALLLHTLTISVRLSKDIGCFGILTHPLDDGVRDFYRRFGFEDLPFDHKRSMIVRIADLELSGFGDAATGYG